MQGPTLLKQHIQDAGTTAAEISRRTGGLVGEDELSRYLSGQRRPNVDHATAIEDATGGAVPVRAWTMQPKRRARRNGS